MRSITALAVVALVPGLLALPTVTLPTVALPTVALPAASATPVAPGLQQVDLDRPDAVDAGALADLAGGGAVPPPPVPEGPALAARAEALQGEAMASRRPVVLTPPRATEPFQVAGVTWDARQGAQGVAVSVRLRQDGRWGAWEALPVADEGPDDGTAEADGARVGTGPLLSGEADGVQVRVDTADGRRPDGLRLDLVDPGTSAADDAPVPGPAATAAAAAPRPAVVTRAQWGADESLAPGSRTVNPGMRALVLHHTAGSDSYSRAEAVQQVRGIYAYHTRSLGWDDIGYNLLVDRYGRVFEGRRGSVDQPVLGAHSGGFNTDTFGVALMGNTDVAPPTAEAVDGLKATVAWVLGRYGVDATGASRLVSAGGGTARWPAGTVVTVPNVMGHRDVGRTDCPGQHLYARLGEIRTYARQATTGVAPERRFTAFPRDLDGDRAPDLLAVDAADRLWSYPGTGAGGFAPRRQVGQGWGSRDLVTQVGDWTGDGTPDVVAREPGTGRLWLHPGAGAGFGAPRVLGTGWQVMDALLGPGDVDGDGRVDLLARHRDGTLHLYRGDGTGGVASRTQVGHGWQSLGLLTAVGDLSGDGRPDLVARDAAGRLLLYTGTGAGVRGAGVLGVGWGSVASLAGVGSWDGRGGPDLLAVTGTGALQLFRGGGGRVTGPVAVGQGWRGWALVG